MALTRFWLVDVGRGVRAGLCFGFEALEAADDRFGLIPPSHLKVDVPSGTLGRLS